MLKTKVTPEVWAEHTRKRRIRDYEGSYRYLTGAAALLSRPWIRIEVKKK